MKTEEKEDKKILIDKAVAEMKEGTLLLEGLVLGIRKVTDKLSKLLSNEER